MDEFERDSRASDWFHSDNDYADYDIADVGGYYPGQTSKKRSDYSLWNAKGSSGSYSSSYSSQQKLECKYTTSYYNNELLYRLACNYIEQRGLNDSYQIIDEQSASKKRLLIFTIVFVCVNALSASLSFDADTYLDNMTYLAIFNIVLICYPLFIRNRIRITTDEAEEYFRDEAAKFGWKMKYTLIGMAACLAISGFFELIYDIPSYNQGIAFLPSIVSTVGMTIIAIMHLIDKRGHTKYANDLKELIEKEGFGQQHWVDEENCDDNIYYLYPMFEGSTRCISDSHRGITTIEDAIKEALYLLYLDPSLHLVDIFKGREKIKTVKRQ